MAVKNEASLQDILTVLRLLANTEKKECDGKNSMAAGPNSFDNVLKMNLILLQNTLSLEDCELGERFSEILGYLDSDLGNEYEVTGKGDKEQHENSCKTKQKLCLNMRTRWLFVKICLRMICRLREKLKTSQEDHDASTEKIPPVDLLSISDQKVISTILQLVVVLGICPNLVSGVGIPVESRSGFSQVLRTNITQGKCSKCLHNCVMTLVQCLDERSLSIIILSRHFIDILAALMQLAYHTCDDVVHEEKPSENKQYNRSKVDVDRLKECGHDGMISELDRKQCVQTITKIMDQMYQPLVVRELMFLQGTMRGGKSVSNVHNKGRSSNISVTKPPKWLREVCGHLLSKCLMKKHGVQNVLRGILESMPGSSPTEWKLCEAIAQLIANCPLQVQSPDEYYKCIAPQVLGILYVDNAKLRQQYSRVAVQTIHAMLRRYPDLATKYIVTPLIKPFLIASGQLDCPRSGDTVVKEREMSHCIETLHKIFVACPDANQLVLESLEKIISPMFELFCFTRQGVSHLRTSLMELLATFFKRSKEQNSFLMLYVLTFNEQPKNSATVDHSPNMPELMKCRFVFQHGGSGGVVLKRRLSPSDDLSSSTTPSIWKNILSEDGGSEARASCLVEILENLRRENVPAQFFLYLLEQVQEILLNSDFNGIEKLRALMIFNVLALMCEKLGPSVLKNTDHMINFIEVTLTRAHHVYMEKAHEDNDVTFELETITMALGMLSALLSGAVKVEASDYMKLEKLSSLLRKLCEEHVEDEVRELANDLLVVILTKGAVWSDRTRENKEKENKEKNDQSSKEDNKEIQKPRDIEVARPEEVDFDAAFEQLCDPLLPARGHALMKLAGLLRARNSKALGKIDVLVKTFQDNLIHEDSYIYLAAIEGLVAAADVKTDDVLPYLVNEFVTCHGWKKETSQEDVEKGVYVGCEQATKSQKTFIERSAPTRMKVGEALLRAIKRCGDVTPHYFKMLLQAFLTGVKDKESFIRASSLSNLGEVCRLSPRTVPSEINEIFYCVSSVLKCDESKEVRQAACLVITLIFRGLGTSLVKELGDTLKDFYQLLKLVESSDSDETTRLHSRAALGELDDVMKEQLFPRQHLVKRITMLP